MPEKKIRIRILRDGPYVVEGDIPLSELRIRRKGWDLAYVRGRTHEVKGKYVLCRCGRSRSMPFCDGRHKQLPVGWGQEHASREPLAARARVYRGVSLHLLDDKSLCAYARFCHTKQGDAWGLARAAEGGDSHEAAVRVAANCPSGRLVAVDAHTGQTIEPVLAPSVAVLQDTEEGCAGPLWIRGKIPVTGADGKDYEVRNRVTLCRCGHSKNKPFCDAMHIRKHFREKKTPWWSRFFLMRAGKKS